MDELLRLSAVAAAGGCACLAVVAMSGDIAGPGAGEWLRRRARAAEGGHPDALRLLEGVPRSAAAESLRKRLESLLERAAWRESPKQFAAGLGLAAAACAAAVALAMAIFVAPAAAVTPAFLTFLGVPCLAFHSLLQAGAARRRRLAAELAPLLELVGLELSGGATPTGALESVLFRSDCELAATLRAQLILSRVAGAAPFEARLTVLARRHDLPPLESMAMVLSLSRDFGSGVGQGLKALATDLRRVQRRELIATSRRALNRVLLPAAVGVLLPFMAILLFPAVVTLWSNFR